MSGALLPFGKTDWRKLFYEVISGLSESSSLLENPKRRVGRLGGSLRRVRIRQQRWKLLLCFDLQQCCPARALVVLRDGLELCSEVLGERDARFSGRWRALGRGESLLISLIRLNLVFDWGEQSFQLNKHSCDRAGNAAT